MQKLILLSVQTCTLSAANSGALRKYRLVSGLCLRMPCSADDVGVAGSAVDLIATQLPMTMHASHMLQPWHIQRAQSCACLPGIEL